MTDCLRGSLVLEKSGGRPTPHKTRFRSSGRNNRRNLGKENAGKSILKLAGMAVDTRGLLEGRPSRLGPGPKGEIYHKTPRHLELARTQHPEGKGQPRMSWHYQKGDYKPGRVRLRNPLADEKGLLARKVYGKSGKATNRSGIEQRGVAREAGNVPRHQGRKKALGGFNSKEISTQRRVLEGEGDNQIASRRDLNLSRKKKSTRGAERGARDKLRADLKFRSTRRRSEPSLKGKRAVKRCCGRGGGGAS